ncbi:MAG: TIM barrel protein [Anaerolineae bacterium]
MSSQNHDDLLFGPAGVPHSTRKRSSQEGIRRVKELGLGCMELEFVQRVSMGEATAAQVRQVAQEEGIRLTVHAPYYINLNSREPEKVQAGRERILQAARIGALCGAESVAIHVAFYHHDPPEEVYTRVKTHFEELVAQLRAQGNTIWLCPETMGKESQFGSLEEVLCLSREVEGVLPCVDFSHLHARTVGAANSYREFADILEQIEGQLGQAGLENMHIHVSGIAYGPKGEKKHLNLAEADFAYLDLLQALKDFDVRGFVICESPNLEEDALLLQEAYLAL